MRPSDFRVCPRCGTAMVDTTPPLRCPGNDCGFTYWHNPIPVVAAIVEVPDGVVLVRNVGWPAKMFGLVTGFLEAEEDPAAACLREVHEELALRGAIESLVGVYPFAQRNQVILAYHVAAAGTIALGDELEDHRVIPIERLKPWPFGTGHAVRDWLDQRRAPQPGQTVRGSESGRAGMAALDLLGRRWILRILWELGAGPRGFTALRRACDQLSPDTLSRRLRELEAVGLVTSAGGTWALTPSGRALAGALDGLARWSLQWRQALPEP